MGSGGNQNAFKWKPTIFIMLITEPSTKKVNHPAKLSCAASGQSHSAMNEPNEVCRNEQRQQMKVPTETARTDKMKTTGRTSQPDLKPVKTNAAKGHEETEPPTPQSLHSHHPKSFCDFASSSAHVSTVSSVNVTLRKHSREEFLMGTEAGKANERFAPEMAVKPFLIEEAPVRDDSQSDWSLSSNGSTFTNYIHLASSYPSKNPEPVNPFLLTGPAEDDLDFGSTTGDNSDVTVYKEIVKKPFGVKSKKYAGIKMTKSREPIPGSEDEAFHKACTKSLVTQFKICQQDSGFDSPVSLIQK